MISYFANHSPPKSANMTGCNDYFLFLEKGDEQLLIREKEIASGNLVWKTISIG